MIPLTMRKSPATVERRIVSPTAKWIIMREIKGER
jgi:hypothetical protein